MFEWRLVPNNFNSSLKLAIFSFQRVRYEVTCPRSQEKAQKRISPLFLGPYFHKMIVLTLN